MERDDSGGCADSITPRMVQQPDATPARRASLLRRILRIKVRWLGISTILLAAILLDGRLPRSILATALGELVGADVSIARLRFEGIWIVADNVQFDAPLWGGPGSEVASVETVRMDLDWSSTLLGSPRLEHLELDGGVLQLVESDSDPPRFNVGSLRTITPRPPDATPRARDGLLPFDALSVRRFKYQVGVLRGGLIVTGDPVPIEASCARSDTDPTQWLLRARLPSAGIAIDGAYDAKAISLVASLQEMPWNRGLLDLLPSRARAVLEAAGPSGTITDATFTASASLPASLVMAIDDFEAKLPDIAELGQWTRVCGGSSLQPASPPTLHVDSAQAIVTATSITLRHGRGTIGEAGHDAASARVPFEATGMVDLSGMPPLDPYAGDDRLTQALEHAAFDLSLRVDGFTLARKGTESCVLLPMAAASALAELHVTNLAFDLSATLHRGRSLLGATSHAIDSTLSLTLRDGTITIPQFPYPLTGAHGRVLVAEDRATLEGLQATGPGRSAVRIDGFLQGLSGAPAIDVVISSDEIMVNDELRRAVERQVGDVLDEIFDLDAARAIEPSLVALGLPPFEPGGRGSFRLRVHRETQTNVPVELSGDIKIIEGRVLLRTFPLPLLGQSGTIHFEPGRVSFSEPISFHSLSGGSGEVSGEIRLELRDDGRLIGVPDLRFSAHGEPANPLLWAAIPPGQRSDHPEWPAQPTQEGAILQSLRPSGTLSVAGRVTRFGRAPEFDIVVDVTGATIGPPINPVATDEIGWPAGLTLTDASARVRITPGRVALERSAGILCGGEIAAAGVFSGGEPSIDIHAGGIDVACAVGQLGLIEPSTSPEWWVGADPEGVADATVAIRGPSLSARVKPRVLNATIGNERLQFRGTSGWIDVDDTSITARDVGFIAGPADSTPDQQSVGTINATVPRRAPAEATWSFTSPSLDPRTPFTRGLLREVGAGDLADVCQALGLALEMPVTAAGERARLKRLDATPTRAALGLGTQTPLAFRFPTTAHVAIIEGTIVSRDLEAPLPGGHVSLSINGDLNDGVRGEPPWGRVTVEAVADGSPALLSIIPEPVRSSLQSLGFNPGRRVLIPDGSVTWGGGSYDAEFLVSLLGASMQLGVGVEEYDGLVDVAVNETSWSVGCVPIDSCVAGTPSRIPSALIVGSRGEPIRARLDIPIGDGIVKASVMVPQSAPWRVEVSASGVPWADVLRSGGVHSAPAGLASGSGIVTGSEGMPIEAEGSLLVTGADFGAPPPDLLNPFTFGSDRRLRELETQFSLHGDLLTLWETELRADGFRLVGEGTVDVASGSINARLRGRSAMPLLGDLLGAVVDPLVQLEVTGGIDQPLTRVAPLPGILSPRGAPAPTPPSTK